MSSAFSAFASASKPVQVSAALLGTLTLYLAGKAVVASLRTSAKRKARKALNGKTFDYVVVGGGSGGAVVAARLSEDAAVTVLLIEAGEDQDSNPLVSVPAACGDQQGTPEIDWMYRAEPSKLASQGLEGCRSRWPRGLMLGGCSSMNYMMYCRGAKEDYDAWEKAGCKGWSYADCLPYFMKSETSEDVTSEYRGKDGPLTVSMPKERNPLTAAFVQASQETGLGVTDDYNGAVPYGAGQVQHTIRGGKRCSTSVAFLKPAAGRPNLTIATGLHASKVLFTAGGEGAPRATGVQYIELEDKAVGAVHATREVVVCGGAVGSAQLLLLSGIGPAAELKELGIPVVADLPVGRNLRDHVAFGMSFDDKCKLAVTESSATTPASLFKYFVQGKGPLASSSLEGNIFVKTGLTPEHSGPDLQILLFTSMLTEKLLKRNFGMRQDYISPRTPEFSIAPVLLHPRSVGYVKLQSTDPLVHPVIEANYLADQHDVDVIVRGAELVMRMAETAALKRYTGALKTYDAAPVKVQDDPLRYFQWATRAVGFTLYHPVGTCKMGAASDPTAVVTPELCVKGVRGLRVADCSVMPQVPSGNTNAPAILVGERAADFIKAAQRA